MSERLYKEWVGTKCGLPQEIADDLPETMPDHLSFCIRCGDEKGCRLVKRDRVFSGKSVEEIEARVLSVPGAWTIEERPKFDDEEQKYALYSERYDTPAGQILGGTHGLNLVGLIDPDFRWKNVRPMLENAHSDILWLLLELKKARQELEEVRENARDEAFERDLARD